MLGMFRVAPEGDRLVYRLSQRRGRYIEEVTSAR